MTKAVLMIQEAAIPVQANFSQISSRIPLLQAEEIEVPTSTQDWNGGMVCLKNYSAAGSIVALVLGRPPTNGISHCLEDGRRTPLCKSPIFLSAHSSQSLRSYCCSLRDHLRTKISLDKDSEIESVALNLARYKDHSLSTYSNNNREQRIRFRENLIKT